MISVAYSCIPEPYSTMSNIVLVNEIVSVEYSRRSQGALVECGGSVLSLGRELAYSERCSKGDIFEFREMSIHKVRQHSCGVLEVRHGCDRLQMKLSTFGWSQHPGIMLDFSKMAPPLAHSKALLMLNTIHP